MHHELKQKAIKLRVEHHLSYGAILKQVPVAKSTLHEWLQHFPLSRERIHELRKIAWKKSEVKIELYRTTRREQREKEDQRVYEMSLRKFKGISRKAQHIGGLMLYVAEGAKKALGKLVLANTDARLIRFFMQWAETFYKVPKNAIRIQLQLYPTMDIESEYRYWERELGIPRGQFYKPYIHKLTPASFSYSESFRHGTCGAYILNEKIRRQVMMEIRAMLDSILMTGV